MVREAYVCVTWYKDDDAKQKHRTLQHWMLTVKCGMEFV